MHFIGASVFRALVLPGVILYPFLFSLSLLSSASLLARVVFGGGCGGWFLPPWCVRPRVGPAVCPVRAGFLSFLSLVFVFLWSVGRSSFFSSLLVVSCSLSLRFLTPRCVAWDALDPWEITY